MADVDFRTHVHGMSNIFLSEIKKITSEFLPKISPVKNPPCTSFVPLTCLLISKHPKNGALVTSAETQTHNMMIHVLINAAW